MREVYEGKDGLIPELPFVGHVLAVRARTPGLKEHAHCGVFEIFYIERGHVEWWVEDEVHRLPANYIHINRPDERHGSLGHSVRPCGYYWIHLAFPKNGLPGLSRKHSDKIFGEFSGMNLHSFPVSHELKQAFRDLLEQHRSRLPYCELAARALLHLLLARLLRDYHGCVSNPNVSAGNSSFAIRKAMKAIEANPFGIKSIRDLADLTGLGVTQFSARFFSEVGFTPAAYLRQQRIERAKRLLLEKHDSLADIAFATGFCSSQHFATVFKQIEGITPSDFVARHQSARGGKSRK